MEQRSKQYFPVMIDVSSLHWIVVGGGVIATRKIHALLNQGVNQITVVAPQISEEILQFTEEYKVDVIYDVYKLNYLDNKNIVYAATDDAVLNRTICRDAKLLNLLVCNVSEQEIGNFITPSFFQRDDLIFSVSSQGKSPILTKLLSTQWANHIDTHIVQLLPVLERLRNDLKRDIENANLRQHIMREATARLFIENVDNYEQWYKSLLKFNC